MNENPNRRSSTSNSELYHAAGAGNGYSNLNQLLEFTRGTLDTTNDSITGTAARDQTFTLDTLGNWTNLSTNGTNQTRTANSQNQYSAISGQTAPTYDYDGNTTSPGSTQLFTFDAWDRIVSFTNGGLLETLTFMPGDRASATDTCASIQTDSYYSISGQVVEDDATFTGCGCCGGGNTTSTYVWGLDYVNDLIERDQTVSGSTTRIYAEHDANWDITSLVNSSSTPSVLERARYDPYGTRTVLTSGWSITSDAYGWNYSFQGGRYDPITGLIHFGARDLNTALGRWMQEDPTGASYTDGMNLYQAFLSNPQVYNDASGLVSMKQGSFFHEVIEAAYALNHLVDYLRGRIWLDQTIGTILNNTGAGVPMGFDDNLLDKRPDILHQKTDCLYWVYDIKTQTEGAASAEAKALFYAETLGQVQGMDVFLGPSNERGTRGAVETKYGVLRWYSPIDGAILYTVTPPPPAPVPVPRSVPTPPVVPPAPNVPTLPPAFPPIIFPPVLPRPRPPEFSPPGAGGFFPGLGGGGGGGRGIPVYEE